MMVLGSEWNVSTTTSSVEPGAELHVFRIDHSAPNQWGGRGVVIKHWAYGLRFKSRHEADAFACEHGLLMDSTYHGSY